MSSYSCRNAYGRAHGRVSEHGKANAVDIGSFVTARGQAALVMAEWGPTARQIAAQAGSRPRPQRRKRQASCARITPRNPSFRCRATWPSAAAAWRPRRRRRRLQRQILPLDLRPGMTIGIPGITLDVPGSPDRSPSSFGLMPPSRLGGPKPPPEAATGRHAERQNGFPARRSPLRLQAVQHRARARSQQRPPQPLPPGHGRAHQEHQDLRVTEVGGSRRGGSGAC